MHMHALVPTVEQNPLLGCHGGGYQASTSSLLRGFSRTSMHVLLLVILHGGPLQEGV